MSTLKRDIRLEHRQALLLAAGEVAELHGQWFSDSDRLEAIVDLGVPNYALVEYRAPENYAVADLSWKINWSSGAAPWQFNTTYNLVRAKECWRVLLCTAYSEAQLHRESAA